jgi:hypothetical protein
MTVTLPAVPDLPGDNALPRWLEEVAGYQVDDLRGRWRLAIDIDGPLDLVLVGAAGASDGANLSLLGSRIDALRAVAESAEQYKDDVPWRMRSGLYQGYALGSTSRDAYTRELNGVLPVVLGARFAQQLRTNAGQPDPLYEYLKGYLMLAENAHRDPQYLRALSDVEWQRMYPDDPTTAKRLGEHFGELLDEPDRLGSVSVDTELIEQSRVTLKGATLPQLMYSRLKLGARDDAGRAGPGRLDQRSRRGQSRDGDRLPHCPQAHGRGRVPERRAKTQARHRVSRQQQEARQKSRGVRPSRGRRVIPTPCGVGRCASRARRAGR